MITLQPITETNFLTAAALSVSPDQGRYVAPAPIILARAYAYRRRNRRRRPAHPKRSQEGSVPTEPQGE